ncbi:NAD/NADP octopine/nopaline dehydrogenase family protein [Clostridium lacusfryxellense]|uniref:NAD/NADP octopine/nopaline dehydrogenase family protein n=1 Tax=Clostridium lacusfryxellense TaxID=205328 RepID=UPI001C0D0D23|nr:NAD/NADP octopine/nopaline dehydrogenase family protein [Clostridium lacusfryxellense]MBU3111263.1 NAD/NADP octopine/nopaline dehydrogenase family protein [Clostridium lacusfryxellense]
MGAKDDISVRLLTSRPDEWNNIIEVFDRDGTFEYSGRLDVISSNPEEVISDADIIISTLPANILREVIQKIKPFIKAGAWIGLMPGNGGGEFYWDKMVNFYSQWTDDSSTMLLGTDEEVQKLCHKLDKIELRGVGSVKEYFGAQTAEKMTAKISNKIALKNIQSPMILTAKGYVPDFKSRYFLEDFPSGLCIIKSFCEIAEIKTPFIDKILMWFEDFAGVEYYVNGRFIGKDLKELALPQNFGINSQEDMIRYYRM